MCVVTFNLCQNLPNGKGWRTLKRAECQNVGRPNCYVLKKYSACGDCAKCKKAERPEMVRMPTRPKMPTIVELEKPSLSV